MNRGRKILFLLLINLGLVFVSLYVLDMFQIIDYKQLMSQIPFLKQAYRIKVEDPFLLERVELEKKWQILDERLRNYNEDKKKLEDEMRSNQIMLESIEKERENVQNMIDNFEKMKAEKASYDKRVDEIASQIEAMPPEAAVKILEKQDDMMVIDVFRRMNVRAADNSKATIVPYLLSLMDPEQSARIQRKMLE